MIFSVIVPVYKVEKYLPVCVESILAQTFDAFELILVDDGSPDGCPAICDAYAAGDKRVKVIHKKNEGVVSARKAGLLASAGQYILFVDGDDWISPDLLARGYAWIREKPADMYCFAHSCEYETYARLQRESAGEGLYQKEEIKEKLYPMLLMDTQMRHMSYSVWKIFCRFLAESCFLSVGAELALGEDMLCVVRAYIEARRVYISREALYHYRMREQSASHGFQIGHYRQIRLALKALKKIEETADDLPEDFTGQIARYGAFMCFVSMVHAAGGGNISCIKEIRRQMRHPLLRRCIRRARFQRISPKTRLTMALLRAERIPAAYMLLRACDRIKGRG